MKRSAVASRPDCDPMIHEPLFFSFQLWPDRSDDRATRIRATYSWSRLIIDIYNGNKFHRIFRLIVARPGNNHWEPRERRTQAIEIKGRSE